MKFVMLVEEGGYQVRYWDETNNVVGECIAKAWDRDKLYDGLQAKGFNIQKKELEEAMKIVDDHEPFVVLSSNFNDQMDLDTFINSLFTIDK